MPRFKAKSIAIPLLSLRGPRGLNRTKPHFTYLLYIFNVNNLHVPSAYTMACCPDNSFAVSQHVAVISEVDTGYGDSTLSLGSVTTTIYKHIGRKNVHKHVVSWRVLV